MWKCYGSVNIFSQVAPICIQITQCSNGVQYIHKSQIFFKFLILIAQGNQNEKSVICIDWFRSISLSTYFLVSHWFWIFFWICGTWEGSKLRSSFYKTCLLINTACVLLALSRFKHLKTVQWRARKSKQGGGWCCSVDKTNRTFSEERVISLSWQNYCR